jgi:hypothetical protein
MRSDESGAASDEVVRQSRGSDPLLFRLSSSTSLDALQEVKDSCRCTWCVYRTIVGEPKIPSFSGFAQRVVQKAFELDIESSGIEQSRGG